MSVALLFDAFIRAGNIGVSREFKREIRKALEAAAEEDGEAAWAAALAHNDGKFWATLRWLEREMFIDHDHGGMGIDVRYRMKGSCDTCWTDFGVSTITLPDGTSIDTTYDCCGWQINWDDDDEESDDEE